MMFSKFLGFVLSIAKSLLDTREQVSIFNKIFCIFIGVISVDDKADYASCQKSFGTSVLSIAEMAELKGLATGVVTTARLTHATPATAYSHSASRRWESDGSLPDKRCKDIGKS